MATPTANTSIVEVVSDLPNRAEMVQRRCDELEQEAQVKAQVVTVQREQAAQQHASEVARKWAVVSYVKKLETERAKANWIRFGFVMAGAAVLAVIAKRASGRRPRARNPMPEPEEDDEWQERSRARSLPPRQERRSPFRRWRNE